AEADGPVREDVEVDPRGVGAGLGRRPRAELADGPTGAVELAHAVVEGLVVAKGDEAVVERPLGADLEEEAWTELVVDRDQVLGRVEAEPEAELDRLGDRKS